jgi:hypothetical protein
MQGRVSIVKRVAAAFAGLSLAIAAFSQQQQDTSSIFLKVHADVIISIRHHESNSDVVEILAVKSDYPAHLLENQVDALARDLGSDISALRILRESVSQGDPNMAALKATFGVKGIIDREKGRLRIAPIIRAFAGAPEPYTVKGITLLFLNETPSDRTIRQYHSSSLNAEAIFTDQPPMGIEYRIELLTQDPTKIEFPEEHQKPLKPIQGKPRNNSVLLIALFVVASLSLGALVYLAMLRGASRAGSRPKK